MFTKAIVRRPCRSMIYGLSNANLGTPDYELAIKQHDTYIEALKKCGVEVIVQEANEEFPDFVFVEDVALCTPQVAIISQPGAESRKGETDGIKQLLQKYYTNIEEITAPATIEPGDIMMVGTHFYIGLSKRTNLEGAKQMTDFLEKFGMTASTVEMSEMLHLKTGMSYLENNNLLVAGEFISKPQFQKFNLLKVETEENYAANCIWVNGKVIVAEGFPKTKKLIENAGYEVITVDVSEYRKLDGGLSCMSLRF